MCRAPYLEFMKNNKNKKWTKFRHKVVRLIIPIFLFPVCYLRYHVKIEKHKNKKKQYLILYNHQTAFDQFFVAMTFKQVIYYVASEDLFSKGFVSSLLRYLVAPIPIKKQSTDMRAVMNCIKVAREGGSIAIAAEGNRTFSGKTEYINPAIVPLAKKLGLPIALFHITGGYGVHPRWADNVRKGQMSCYVARVIDPEEYNALSDGEMYELIKNGLYVNEARADSAFYSKHLAENLERAFYYCPYCGLSEFKSNGDIVECKHCGRKIRYLPTKEFRGVGFEFPYRFATEWYDAQSAYMNSIDTRTLTEKPVYTEGSSFIRVIPYKNKEILAENAEISLYGDKITVKYDADEMIFPFEHVRAVTILGRNKVNIYIKDDIYQLKGPKEMNGVKYVHFFNRHKNILKGNENVQFLGL